jgi:LEA14-like dessication related protein
MIYLKTLLFVIASALLLSSCGSIQPLTVSKVENVKLNNLSKNSLTLEVTMAVKNPNNYRFKMVDNHLDLYLNNSEIGGVKIKERIVIPRKSEQSYTFLLNAEFSRLAIGAIPSLLNMLQTRQVELKLVGDVKVRTMGISKRFPLEITEKVSLSRDKK